MPGICIDFLLDDAVDDQQPPRAKSMVFGDTSFTLDSISPASNGSVVLDASWTAERSLDSHEMAQFLFPFKVPSLFTRSGLSMAQSYIQLQRQIESLRKQADKVRQQEVAGVIDRIKVAIAHYGLTAEQLGLGTSRADKGRPQGKRGSSSSSAKYADGAGGSWSGRGPRPRWLREAIASGKSLQDFAIGASTAGRATRTNGKAKPPSQVRYRDQAGNTWTGMGPQPRWLKEAVAAGTPLEQLAA